MSTCKGWQLLENKIKDDVLKKINNTNILTVWSSLTNYFISLGMLKVFKVANQMLADADKFDKENK